MVASDFFEVLIAYEFFSMTVLKVARKSIGERVNAIFGCCICWSRNGPAFPGTKKGIFLSPKVIS